MRSDQANALGIEAEYRADLLRAKRALELACLQYEVPDGSGIEVAMALVDLAVMSYWLCFAQSDSRRSLELSDVPEELRVAHAGVKRYRNQTLAHADSRLHESAVGTILDRRNDTISAREPILLTARFSPPVEFLDNLAALIESLLVRVQTRVDSAHLSLTSALQQEDLHKLWDQGEDLEA